ncbi:hypothetical protein ACA910_022594 [Epithemia clementina (nom. ined.)]
MMMIGSTSQALMLPHPPTFLVNVGAAGVPNPMALLSVMEHSTGVMVMKASTAYTNSLLQHPLLTKMATGGILATAGDAIAQSKDVDQPYDGRRALSFMLFDMAYRALQHAAFPIIVATCQGQYLGPALSSVLQHNSGIFSSLPTTEYAAAMEQTLASQLGIVPFLYYPVFFSLTALVQGLSAEGALERAKEKFVPLMKRNLLFWIPVQFVQFGFVEEQLQIPFLSVAGLCWTFILSVAAGSATNYNQQGAAAAAAVTAEPKTKVPMPPPSLASTMDGNMMIDETLTEQQESQVEPALATSSIANY